MSARIKSAAIVHKGVIYTGKSHCTIGLQMIGCGVCNRPYPSGDAQGFVTDDGIFVNRTDALKIAIKSGQVEQGKTVNKHYLFSEDLWR